MGGCWLRGRGRGSRGVGRLALYELLVGGALYIPY